METSTATASSGTAPDTSASVPDEFDLDVRIVSSGLIAPGFSSEDCTSDNCGDTSGPNC